MSRFIVPIGFVAAAVISFLLWYYLPALGPCRDVLGGVDVDDGGHHLLGECGEGRHEAVHLRLDPRGSEGRENERPDRPAAQAHQGQMPGPHAYFCSHTFLLRVTQRCRARTNLTRRIVAQASENAILG